MKLKKKKKKRGWGIRSQRPGINKPKKQKYFYIKMFTKVIIIKNNNNMNGKATNEMRPCTALIKTNEHI